MGGRELKLDALIQTYFFIDDIKLLNTTELQHTQKKIGTFFTRGSSFILTALLLKAHSHPERDFSGAPLMPFATLLSLLLHQEYLTASHCTHS